MNDVALLKVLDFIILQHTETYWPNNTVPLLGTVHYFPGKVIFSKVFVCSLGGARR